METSFLTKELNVCLFFDHFRYQIFLILPQLASSRLFWDFSCKHLFFCISLLEVRINYNI